MSNVVSLGLLVDIVENDNSSHKIGHLAGGQLVQIGATIFATVSVHPIQFELFAGRWLHFADVIRILYAGRCMQNDGTTA